MNKILLSLVLLIGCSHDDNRSCDLCGKWSFERVEYGGYTTTDCKDIAHRFYKNSYIVLNQNSFTKTYYTDGIQNENKNIQITVSEYDSDLPIDLKIMNAVLVLMWNTNNTKDV